MPTQDNKIEEATNEVAQIALQNSPRGGLFYKEVERVLNKVYQAGRDSLKIEMEHELQKLADGFAHPKDCEMCQLLTKQN